MADPVSAFAGLIVAAGTTISVIAKQIESVRHGPLHVKQLLEDIQHFKAYLQHADRILQKGRSNDKITSPTARDLIRTIQRTKDELEAVVDGVTKGEDQRIRRVKWYFNESKCQQIRSRLERHQQEMSHFLELMQM